MPTDMTAPQFELLLDRLGSDLQRWPPAEADAAQRLLAASPQARRALAAAQRLDHWLAGLREHQAPPGLAAQILARARQPDLARARRPDSLARLLQWLAGPLWRPVLVAALPVLAGFAIGLALPEHMDAEIAQQIGALAFIDIYQELDDAQ